MDSQTLLETTLQQKNQTPLAAKLVQEEISNDENHDHVYDLPDVGNITRKVLLKLFIASIIALIFLIAEIVGGILASSLAILSDAAHMFSDLSGFFISIFSVWISTMPASQSLSFGYHRAEVIGALASIFLIWGLSILLLYEATHRIIKLEKVEEPLYMLITACFGLVCNLIMAKVLHSSPGHQHTHSHQSKNKHSHNEEEEEHSHKNEQNDCEIQKEEEHNDCNENKKNLSNVQVKDNFNLKAAMIHVIGDIIQSIGVLIAAIIIYFLGEKSIYWHLSDPICTYLFSILVLFTTFSVAKECISVLMEGTPVDFDIQQFESELKQIKEVVEIHDLHIWSLSKGKPSLSCHIFAESNTSRVLQDVTRLCRKYGIYHSTVQVEQFNEKGQKNYIKCDHNLH